MRPPDMLLKTAAIVSNRRLGPAFTLSTGMGGMAIFGSYIGKEHSLMGEAIHVITLDTLVAFLAGVIIFPACFTFNLEVNAGPSLSEKDCVQREQASVPAVQTSYILSHAPVLPED